MKLPKTLITAIMVGIAVQTALSSCTKEKPEIEKKEVKKESEKTSTYNCPACGMG